jgi:hypothetical protein
MKKTMMCAVVAMATTMVAPAYAQERERQIGDVQARAGFGIGAVQDAESLSGVSVGGPALSFETYLGGYVLPGLAFGVYGSEVASIVTAVTVNGVQNHPTSNDVSLNLFSAGPYLDWYPVPYRGLHILLTSGVSAVSLAAETSATAWGGNIGIGIGYDWRIAPWSERDHRRVGFMFRVITAQTAFPNGQTENALAPSVQWYMGWN